MEFDANGNFVSYVTVNIEDVKVGDLVYSYNTLTGEVEQREVTQTLAKTSDHINRLTIVDEFGVEQVIETTDVHPFWVVTDDPDLSRAARSFADGFYHENVAPGLSGFWVEAKDLRIGDVFLGANGELSTLVATERLSDKTSVFNITVTGNHNYFIRAKECEYEQTTILVHNAWKCEDEFLTDPREIYFSQDNMDYLISGPSENIEELRDLLASGELDPRDIEPILLCKDGITGAVYSLDNRRLWAAKEAGTLVNARWATDAEWNKARQLGKSPMPVSLDIIVRDH